MRLVLFTMSVVLFAFSQASPPPPPVFGTTPPAPRLQGSGPDNSIALSVSKPNQVLLSQSVTLIITLTNRSDEVRYVHRDVGDPLEFAVRGPDGKLVHSFYDPPPPPPIPNDSTDLIRIEGKQWVPEVELKDPNFSFTHAGTVKLTVTDGKLPAKIGLAADGACVCQRTAQVRRG